MKVLENFYKTTVSTLWATGTGNRYVATLPTPTSGWLVVSPNNASLREIVAYSAVGTDGGGNYVTVSARGVGGTTEQTHAVNEPVRMNITAEHWADIYVDPVFTGDVTVPVLPTNDTDAVSKKYVDDIAIAGSPKATNSVYGISKLSTAAVDSAIPIVVGDNDTRVPTQGENNALAGTSGTPSSTNKYVTNDDTAETGASKVLRLTSGGKVTTSTIDTGTTAGKIVVLDGSAKLPAVDGSQLTNLPGLEKFIGIGDATNNKNYWNYPMYFSSIWTSSQSTLTDEMFYATRTISNASGYNFFIPLNGQFGNLIFATKDFAVEFFLKVSSVGTNTVKFGFTSNTDGFYGAYDQTNWDTAEYAIYTDSKLYSHVSNGSAGTVTEITGITLTNLNRYRIEVDAAGECRFYINGVLKDTRTTNVPNGGSVLFFLGGSGNTTDYIDTISLPMFSVKI